MFDFVLGHFLPKGMLDNLFQEVWWPISWKVIVVDCYDDPICLHLSEPPRHWGLGNMEVWAYFMELEKGGLVFIAVCA